MDIPSAHGVRQRGRLFYLMGASGAGKDSLMDYARRRLGGRGRIHFARRHITRPAASGGEDHVAVGAAEFERRLREGLFAMHWDSHGLRYGVGRELEAWLADGGDVVVNGSRAYLSDARRRFPDLVGVLIEASEAVRRRRLRSRAREDADAVERRIARGADLCSPLPGPVRVIVNEGALEEAGERLVALLLGEEGACD
ncbi:MAG: phosphonate metabolism protein/1,5-bisphosphokinase (PRPP-forming) PhnN [Gammaproteobacteria bacterium]|nr:phosphonate metabolism protein/1,5-bisphosphokinase (PRPP-forming) PhnN [Gammaproteobacteria bacterium]